MAELTPEQQKEVNDLAAALRSEFADTEASKEATSAKKDLSDLKPEMLKALKRALEHGTVEQMAKVAMWGYGKLLDEGKAGTDPIRDLIAGMPSPVTHKDDEPSAEVEAKAVDVPMHVLEESEPDENPA